MAATGLDPSDRSGAFSTHAVSAVNDNIQPTRPVLGEEMGLECQWIAPPTTCALWYVYEHNVHPNDMFGQRKLGQCEASGTSRLKNSWMKKRASSSLASSPTLIPQTFDFSHEKTLPLRPLFPFHRVRQGPSVRTQGFSLLILTPSSFVEL